MQRIDVTDPEDPRLEGYRNLTDMGARLDRDHATGTYVGESLKVLQRAIAAGHGVVSVLAQDKWLTQLDGLVATDTEVFVVDGPTAESVTGFAVHRGVLAIMQRPVLPIVADLVSHARTVVIADDITDHTNVGSLFRAAAALGADAVIVSPRGADPLYRRSVRVSMGAVFQVQWTRARSWPELRDVLHTHGFDIAALTLTEDAISLRDYLAPAKVALVVGTEGDGLSATALRHADTRIVIPMRDGVDSLNVAAAASVALWHVQAR